MIEFQGFFPHVEPIGTAGTACDQFSFRCTNFLVKTANFFFVARYFVFLLVKLRLENGLRISIITVEPYFIVYLWIADSNEVKFQIYWVNI